MPLSCCGHGNVGKSRHIIPAPAMSGSDLVFSKGYSFVGGGPRIQGSQSASGPLGQSNQLAFSL